MNAAYLLDTCAWIDAFSAPELLRPEIRKLINLQRLIHVSAISLLEVARKESVGQLRSACRSPIGSKPHSPRTA